MGVSSQGRRRRGRYKLPRMKRKAGCPAWIRTTIDGVRVRSLTIRRRGTDGRPRDRKRPSYCQRRVGCSGEVLALRFAIRLKRTQVSRLGFRRCRIETGVVHGAKCRQCAGTVASAATSAGSRKAAGPARSSSPHLWCPRPRHEQLSLAHCSAGRRELHRRGCLLADRTAWRGSFANRTAFGCRNGSRRRGTLGLWRQAAPSKRFPVPLGRDGGMPSRRKWGRIR